jgi:putative addiction module component (TIGR02574 family)
MTAVAEKIMRTALELPPVDRAELIERLFISFDPSPGSAVDEAWAAEVESRIDAFDAGKIKASSADEVFKRISGQ